MMQRTPGPEKTRQKYSQDVYNSRFTHFRVLRLLSVVMGTLLCVLLGVGLWRLYIVVFNTIEDTEHLFFMSEGRRTDVIDFSRLERVRDAWTEKQIVVTSTLPAVFGELSTASTTPDSTTAAAPAALDTI